MNLRPHRPLTRGRWLWLGASAVACAAVVTLTRAVHPVRMTGDFELAALVSQRAALTDCDDHTRNEFRRRVDALASGHKTPTTLADLSARLGPAWRWEQPGPGKSVLTRVMSRLRDWSVVVDTIDVLQASPGVTLISLEVTTAGTRTHRTPVRVVIELAFTGGGPQAGK